MKLLLKKITLDRYLPNLNYFLKSIYSLVFVSFSHHLIYLLFRQKERGHLTVNFTGIQSFTAIGHVILFVVLNTSDTFIEF